MSKATAAAASKSKDLDIQKIPLEQIRLREDLQVRVEIDPSKVREYARMLAEEDVDFDPIDIFNEADEETAKAKPYYNADGWHRIMAYKKAKREKIPCLVHDGTFADANELACRKNGHHGSCLNNKDKRKAVVMVLDVPEHRRRANTYVAQMVGVSPTFVQNMRAARAAGPVEIEPRKRKHRSRSTGEKSGNGGAQPAIAVRERAETETAVQTGEDRIKTLHGWLNRTGIEWPSILELLNKNKRFRFLAMARSGVPVVVLQDTKQVKEVIPHDIFMKDGKLNIEFAPDTETV